MSRYYYASKISDNISVMDNGCLICFNVPIARTGVYKYLREELGLDGQGIVEVHRTPEEVFNKVAMASFEGKAFTDTHPAVDVTSDNWSIYSKGEVVNVRRGEGDQNIYLMADIIVRDPVVIDEIQSGVKREISSGYNCCYVEGKDGKIYQKDIRGNHVALVQAGRAGSHVRINDAKQRPEVTTKYKFIKKLDKAVRNCYFVEK